MRASRLILSWDNTELICHVHPGHPTPAQITTALGRIAADPCTGLPKLSIGSRGKESAGKPRGESAVGLDANTVCRSSKLSTGSRRV